MSPVLPRSRPVLAVLAALLLVASAPPPLAAQAVNARFQGAEKLLSEANYDSALENYRRQAQADLDQETRDWLEYRLADIPLQKELARPRATLDATLLPLREAVAAQLAATPQSPAPGRELQARIWESLGDSYWLLPRAPVDPKAAARDFPRAWQHYRDALDFWSGSTDLPLAKERYLAIFRKLLRPIRRGEPANEVLALVPEEYVQRAASIAEHPEDKVTLKLALALRQQRRETFQNREAVGRLLEEALELSRGTPLLDEALWHNAQFRERAGKATADGQAAPDLPTAISLYRELAGKIKAADSGLPAEAERRIAELTSPKLALEPLAQFLPGSQVSFRLTTQNLATAEFSLYRLDLARAVELAKTPGNNAPPVVATPFFLKDIMPTWAQETRSWSEGELDLGNYESTPRLIRYPDALEEGAYLLEARSKGLTARTLLLVSSLRATVLKSGADSLVWAVDTADGKPADGAEVVLWVRKGKAWSALRGTADDQGLAKFSDAQLTETGELLALVRKGAGQTYAGWSPPRPGPLRAQPYYSVVRLESGAASTARWMLLAPRQAADARPEFAERRPTRYELRYGRQVLAQGALVFNEFGIAMGEAPLPGSVSPRAALVLALFDTPAGETPAQPLVELNLPKPSRAVTPAETAAEPAADTVHLRILGQDTFSGSGRRPIYQSNVPLTLNVLATNAKAFPVPGQTLVAHARFLVSLFGGRATTNAEGIATFQVTNEREVPRNALVHVQVYTESRKENAAYDEVETLLAFGGETPLTRVYTDRRIYTPGQEVAADLAAVDPWGEPRGQELEVRWQRLERHESWMNPLHQRVEKEELAKARAEVPSFPPPPSAPDKGWTRVISDYRVTELSKEQVSLDAATGRAKARFTPTVPGLYEVAASVPGAANSRVSHYFMVRGTDPGQLQWFPPNLATMLWLDGLRPPEEPLPALAFGQGHGHPQLLTVEAGGIAHARVLAPTGPVENVDLPREARNGTTTLTSLTSSTPSQFRLGPARQAAAGSAAEPLPLTLSPEPARPGAAATLRIQRPPANQPARRIMVWLERAERVSFAAARVRARKTVGFDSLGVLRTPPFFLEDNGLVEFALPLVLGLDGRILAKRGDRWSPLEYGAPETGHADRQLVRWSDPFYDPRPVLDYGQPHESDGDALPLDFYEPWGGTPRTVGFPVPLPVPARGARILAEGLDLLPQPAEGAQTELELAFHWPDTPGGWRIAVLALDRAGAVAYGEQERLVQEPLEAAISAPAYLRHGDSALAEAVLENYSETAREVSLELTAVGGGIEPVNAALLAAPVRLEPGERRVLAWKTRPDPAARGIDLTLRLKGGEEFSVTRELRVPVLPAPSEDMLQARATALPQPGQTRELTLDWEGEDRPLPENAPLELRLRAFPGPASVAVFNARRQLLATREAANLEERLSGILPGALLASAPRLQETAGGREKLEELLSGQAGEAPEVPRPLPGQPSLLADRVRTVLDNLALEQLPAGGWSWEPGQGEADAFTTAWAVWALAQLRDAGWGTRPDVLTRGADYLETALAASLPQARESGVEPLDLDLQVWALNALIAARDTPGKPPGKVSPTQEKALAEIWKRFEDLTPGGQALYTLCASRNAPKANREHLEASRAAVMRGALYSQSSEGPGTPVKDLGPVLASWGLSEGWVQRLEATVNSTSLALLALRDVQPALQLRRGGTHWLALQLLFRETNQHDSLARALGGIALAQALQNEDFPVPQGTISGEVEGKPFPAQTFSPANALSPLEWGIDDLKGKAGPPIRRLSVSFSEESGTAPLWISACLESPAPRAAGAGQDAAPARSLRRTLLHTVSRPTLFEGNVPRKEAVTESSPITRGEEVEMALELSVPRKGLRYVTLRLPLPAGLVPAEPVREGAIPLTPASERDAAGGGLAGMRARPYEGGLLLLARELPAGDWRLLIPLRSPNPGEYDLPPAELREGYQPSPPAWSPAQRVTILPEAGGPARGPG
jgi:hypothetical protein